MFFLIRYQVSINWYFDLGAVGTEFLKMIPTFDGKEAYFWFGQYFEAIRAYEEEKLSEAVKALGGDAPNCWLTWRWRNLSAAQWTFDQPVAWEDKKCNRR